MLRKNAIGHVSLYIGQAKVAAAVTESKSFVIQSHQVQDRGVQIVDMDRVLDSPKSKVVRLSVGHASLHTPTCHPDGKTNVVVIAPRSAT